MNPEIHWQRAKNKKFRETVVFVHHYGGNRASVRKHQDLVEELGFDSVAFTLSLAKGPRWLKGSLINDFRPGLREFWESEIAQIFAQVPGPKVLYSFSFPSAPAVVAMVAQKPFEFRAWICDGGPFLMPLTCFWNYFTHVEPTPQLWKKSLRLALGYASLGWWKLSDDLHRALERLPTEFPILSIRSWQDPLVPITAIDEVFAPHRQVRLETLTLPEAGHINGLQRFPAEYVPRVSRFLQSYGTHATKEEDLKNHGH